MKYISIIKSIAILIVFSVFVISSFLHTNVGVVVDQKYEYGKYLFLLRDSPSTWVETNAFTYYLQAVMPWIFKSIVVIAVIVGLIRFAKQEDD